MSKEEQTQIPQPTAQDQMAQRMSRPLDTSVKYHRIDTASIVELVRLIDEIPMKYAKQMLPVLQMSIEPLPEYEENNEP